MRTSHKKNDGDSAKKMKKKKNGKNVEEPAAGLEF